MSIESGMLVTCCMQCCYCGLFSFAYVYLDQLKLCGVCVDGLGYVYICECYVAHDECGEPPPSLFVFPVSAYGGVVRYFWCFRFICEFCFWLRVV